MTDIAKQLHQLKVIAEAARKVDRISADRIEDACETIKDQQEEIARQRRQIGARDGQVVMLQGLVRELVQAFSDFNPRHSELIEKARRIVPEPKKICSPSEQTAHLAARGGE